MPLTDNSQIREVPDHQEVYLDIAGYSSVVVEILEYVNKGSDEEALQYHFGDLVEGTGDSTTIIKQENVIFKNLRYVFTLCTEDCGTDAVTALHSDSN